MAYIGNKLADSYTSFAKQDFTTSATTSYTLDYPVANANEIALFINFVRQEPTTAYTASGTSLTLTSATSATDDMYCVFLGKAVQTVNPPAGSVGLSQLSATGTKDSTTFLRGDNTFASVFQNYGASAYMSGTQVIGTGAATKVSLNAEYYDENSEFDSTTNYRYTASTNGKYYIFGGVGQNGQTGANVIWTPYIYKNGSELIRGSQTTDYGVSYWFPVGGLITTLNATDYIELYVFHNKGSDATINGDSNTILTVLRIG